MMISCVDFLPLLVCELLGFASCFFHPISLYTINVSLFRGEMYSEWFVCLLFLFIYFLLLSQSLCFFLSSSRDIRILINCFALLCVRYFDAHFFYIQRICTLSIGRNCSKSVHTVSSSFLLILLLFQSIQKQPNKFRMRQRRNIQRHDDMKRWAVRILRVRNFLIKVSIFCLLARLCIFSSLAQMWFFLLHFLWFFGDVL